MKPLDLSSLSSSRSAGQHSSQAALRTRPTGGDPFADRPFLVFWEMTRACALACSHCRAEAQYRRDPNELSTREAERVVDQLVDLKPPMLVLTGGDPMERQMCFISPREPVRADCVWLSALPPPSN